MGEEEKLSQGLASGDISRFGILSLHQLVQSRGTFRLHQMPQLLTSCLSMGRRAL